jgi:hypothetical protein
MIELVKMSNDPEVKSINLCGENNGEKRFVQPTST